MGRLKSILLILIIVILAVASFFAYKVYSKSYVATVNGEKISTGEFKLMVDTVKSQMQSKEKTLKDFNTIIDGKRAIDLAKERALESIVNYKIENQKAIEQNVVLTEQEKATANNDVNKMSSNLKAMEKLKGSGLSLEDFKEINIQFNTANKLKEKTYGEIQSNLKTTEQEAKSYFDNNKDLYTTDQEIVRARHILIKTTDENKNELPQDQIVGLRAKAEEVLTKVKAGEDFVTLAKQYSDDPGSKDNGGEYTFARGEMTKVFEDAAFSLKPGEISGIVKTEFGFHIIKLEEKFESGQVISFETVKNRVKLDAQYDKMLEGWKKKSTIIRNDEVYNSI